MHTRCRPISLLDKESEPWWRLAPGKIHEAGDTGAFLALLNGFRTPVVLADTLCDRLLYCHQSPPYSSALAISFDPLRQPCGKQPIGVSQEYKNQQKVHGEPDLHEQPCCYMKG